MYRSVSFLFACFLLPLFGIAQEDAEMEQPQSLYESVVAPDRMLLRRIEQADRLFETGRSSEAAQLLGNVLEDVTSAFIVPEESAGQTIRTLRQTVSDHIIDRIRKLPKEAQDSYAFQFEPTAKRLLENALTAGSPDEIQQVAQKYYPTESGASAALLVGLMQLERGDYAAASLTLEKLKRYHPALPDAQTSLLNSMLEELQGRLQNDVAPSPSGISESAWLEQIGWRLPAGSPSQHQTTQASLPLVEQNWAVPLYTRLIHEREVDAISRMLESGEDVYIPASQPLVVGNLFITRTLNEIIAVDTNTGKRLWAFLKPEYRFPNNASVPSLSMGEISPRLFFWHDRITHQLSSDGEKLFSIEDFDLQSINMLSFGRLPKLRGNIEDPRYLPGSTLSARDLKTGQLLWQAGKFPYVQKTIDALFTQKPRTPNTPTGQINVDETIFTDDEKILKETWFLGAPLPLQDRLYVIGETDGVLQLFVLDRQTGSVVAKQVFAQIPSSLTANFIRRTYPLFPSAASGILLCPTGNGLVVALDAATLSPLWCFTYAAAPTLNPVNRQIRNQQRQFPGMGMGINDHYMRQLFNESGWQVPSIMIDRQKVLIAPPDQAALYCLDLCSGKLLWQQTISRLNALYVAGIQNDKAFLVTPTNLMSIDMNTGEDVTFKEHQFHTTLKPAGVGVHSGHQYFIPFTDGYLAVADLNDGKLTWLNASGSAVPPANKETTAGLEDRPRVLDQRMGFVYGGYNQNIFSSDLIADNVFQESPQFGNLVGIKGRFFSQSPTQILCFDQKEPLKRQAELLLQAEPDSSEGLLQRGRILKSDGKLAEAIDAFRLSLKSESNIEAADALRNNLLEALRKDYATWASSGQELESLAEFPDERGTVLYVQIEGALRSGQTDKIVPLLEKVFTSGQNQVVLIPMNSNYAAQLPRALGSLFEQNLAQGHLPALQATWEELAETFLQQITGQSMIERLSMFVQVFRNTAAAEKAKQMLQDQYALHGLPSALDLLEKNTAFTKWSELSSPYIWKPGKVVIQDVTSSFESLPPFDTNHSEAQQTIQRLVKIARSSVSPRFGIDQLIVPFFEASNSEPSAFTYVLRPWQQELFLCCNDSAGQEQWRLAVPMSDFQNFSRLPHNDEHTAYIKGFQNFLLFVYGNTMTAIIVPSRAEQSAKILWTKTLSSAILTQQDSNRTSPFGYPGQNPKPYSPFPNNSVFVSPHTVCCRDARCVYGLEPFTGKILWVRKTAFENCTILGDTENLFLAFPDVRQVIAIDPASGRELASGLLPSGGTYIFGTNIVCLRRLGDSNELALYVCDLRDIHNKRRRALLVADMPDGQWMIPIPEKMLQNRLNNTSLLQMLYGNRFISLANRTTKSLQIYDLLTKQNLLPEGNDLLKFVSESKRETTMRCDVEFVDDKFLVLFTKNVEFLGDFSETVEENGKRLRRNFNPVRDISNNAVGEGIMMLFDSLGKPCWEKPVEITNWSRLLNVSERLPVMLFSASFSDREIIDGKPSDTNKTSVGIMGIDKRSGERRFRVAVAAQPPTLPALLPFRVHADPLVQEIIFMTPQDRQPRVVKASFTDETE